jgi:hypothetical protein
MGNALEAICAKNFGVNMLDAGGPTLYTRLELRAKEVLRRKEERFTQSLPRYENKGDAHKRREKTSPVFMQLGNLLTFKVEETEAKSTKFPKA